MAKKRPIREEVVKAVSSKVDKSVKRGLSQDYVEELRDRIVTRTRLGIGVNPDTGKGERLKALDKNYIKRRKGSSSVSTRNKIDRKIRKKTNKGEKPNLSSKTSPGKSNLTATGQLLDSLTVIKLKLKKAFGFKISVADRRGRDLFGNSSKIGNRKLIDYLAKQGRYFLGFTQSQRRLIAKEIRNIIIKGLK